MSDANKFWVGLNFEITGKCDPGKLSYPNAFRRRRVTFEKLAKHIHNGKPWMPAILNGNERRWQNNANYAELIALDHDDGMAIDEAKAHPIIAPYCGLGIPSASHKPEHHKFRTVYAYWEIISHDDDGNSIVVSPSLREKLDRTRSTALDKSRRKASRSGRPSGNSQSRDCSNQGGTHGNAESDRRNANNGSGNGNTDFGNSTLRVGLPTGGFAEIVVSEGDKAKAERFRQYPAWQLIRIANRYLAEIVGNADPACKDASRFFFGAPDREPFLLNESAHLPESFLDDAVAWHEAIEAEERKRAEIARKQWEKQRASLSDGDADRLLESALYTIDPDCDYNQWIAIGMSLAGMGDQYLALWDNWSKGAKSYKPGDCDKRWRGFSRKEPKPEVIFGIAKKYGFRFPTKSGTGFDGDRTVRNKGTKAKAKTPKTQPKAKSQTPSRPIVDIGNDEFFKRLDTIPTTGLVALKGQPGSGKTTAIAEIIKGLEFTGNQIAVSVTHLESLGRQHAVDCQGAYIADALITDDGRVFNEDLHRYVNFLSLCAPSLAKIFKLYARVLVLDEPYPLFEFILSSKPCERERAFIIEILSNLIRHAELVIVAGAEIDNALLEQLEAMRGDQATVITSQRNALPYAVEMVGGKLDEFLIDYLEQAKATPDGMISMAFFDSKATQLLVAARLEELGRKPFIHNGDNSGDELQKKYASSSGLDIPALIRDGYTDFLHTPSCGIGISIRENTDKIHGDIYCIFEAKTITPDGMAQMCDRVRASIKRRVFCHEKGRGYSHLTPLGKHTTDTAEFLADLHADSSAAIREMHHAITGNVRDALYQDKCDTPWYWLLAEIECKRNRQMESPRDALKSILSDRGKSVTMGVTNATKDQVEEMSNIKKSIREKRKAQRTNQLLAADDLNQSQVEAIMSKGSMTSANKLAIEKFAIRDFYQQPVTAELIELDNDGRYRRAVINAEQLLNEDHAINATRESVERATYPIDFGKHPGLKSDIDKSHWRYRLLTESGFTAVFRRIVDGGDNITAQEIDQICEHATRHADDWRHAELLNVAEMNDNAIIGHLFNRVGIKRKRTQITNDSGKRVSVYQIDQDALDTLLHTVFTRESKKTAQTSDDKEVYNKRVCASPLDQDPAYRDEMDIYSSVKAGAVEFEAVESCLSAEFRWLMGV